MSKLQNNFTTPEQSKRLLELGVPADSADMLWDGCIDDKGWVFEDFPFYTDKPFSYYQLLYRQEDTVHILPCWSVGRLIEIITICCNHYSGNNDIIFNQAAVNHGIIECLVAYLSIEKKDVSVDFSKLEE